MWKKLLIGAALVVGGYAVGAKAPSVYCGTLEGWADGTGSPCEAVAAHFEPFCARHWYEVTQ